MEHLLYVFSSVAVDDGLIKTISHILRPVVYKLLGQKTNICSVNAPPWCKGSAYQRVPQNKKEIRKQIWIKHLRHYDGWEDLAYLEQHTAKLVDGIIDKCSIDQICVKAK